MEGTTTQEEIPSHSTSSSKCGFKQPDNEKTEDEYFMYLAIEYCTDLYALSSSLTATAQSILGACVKPADDLSTGMVSSSFLGLRRDVHETLAAKKSLETARNLPEVLIDVAALETRSQA